MFGKKSENWLIVGLGNPGKEYERTRHNAGFRAVDVLADSLGCKIDKGKFQGLYGQCNYNGIKLYLLKPLTYMNLSGRAVREAVAFYKADPASELIVVSDDIDLEPGKIRIRKKGSAGGQNGLRNIIEQLGTDAFIRVRVGTGAKPAGWDLADWVLSRPDRETRALIDDAQERAAKACVMILTEGPDRAMNLFN